MKSLILILYCVGHCMAHEIVDWNEGLKLMQEGQRDYYALYIGREDSNMLEQLRADERDWGITFLHLSSDMEAINPMTGRSVPGSLLISNFTGPVNDLAGGSLLWFDREGIMQPDLTIIANFHRNRLPVVELYAKYATSSMRGKMALADFGRIEGLAIAKTLVMEVQAGQHANFSHLIKRVDMEGGYLRPIINGKAIDPRRAPNIYVMTNDGRSPIFIAQMREIWFKMGIEANGQTEYPPLVVIAPVGTTCPGLDILGIRYEMAFVTSEELEAWPCPTVLLPGDTSGQRHALEIRGFFPGEQVAAVLLPDNMHALIEDRRVLHPDIPIGEVDRPAIE